MGGYRKGLLLFMAFYYDFLVSKPLFNQYGHSVKMKSQSLHTIELIELTNNRTQTSL